MKPKELLNTELGLKLNYWNGVNKNERVFIAKQMMQQLGYKGGNDTLKNYELEEGIDKITLKKKDCPEFFKQLHDLESVGFRTSAIIMLYESGVWKLIMGSKKQIGINTRNWLAREVLPSIRNTGKYNANESINNPLSYLHKFTENKEQINNSKLANSKISITTKDFITYHNQVHKLVNGMTAKEIQKFYGSKESAREIIRQNVPENASTIALIDSLFVQYNRNLEEIAKTGIQNHAKETFKALYSLGVKPLI